jgi:predicted Zn-dependent protease
MNRPIFSALAISLAALTAGCGGGNAAFDPQMLAPVIGQRNAAGLGALSHGFNAMTMGEKDENALGESVGIAITNNYRLVPNDNLQRYVMLVGITVANTSPGANYDWVFGVVDSPDVNAFSGPHGYVFITRGALRQMQSEAELAGVLAHEIAHVCNHDGLELVKNAEGKKAMQQGMQAGDARLQQFSSMADTGFDVLTSQAYSQPQEDRADAGAVQFMAAAGYDAGAYLRYLQRIQSAGAGAGAGRIMSTHPGIGSRIQKVSQALGTVRPGGATLPNRFQRNVAGL